VYSVAAPPKPPYEVVPIEVCHSSSTVQIRFRKNYFSDENGAVSNVNCMEIGYVIINVEMNSSCHWVTVTFTC
jgi:hypothetical protein